MIGLSVWFYRNKEEVSVTDRVIESILTHNSKFFSEYYIITNFPERISKLSKNIVIIDDKKQQEFVKQYLPDVEYLNIRDHQWSDIATLFLDELIWSNCEGKLYIDSDFVISNAVLISELERKCDKYTNFYDRNFYLLEDYPKYYINAAVSYMPPYDMRKPRKVNKDNPVPSVLRQMKDEVIRRLSKGLAKEYNDIGPRLLACYSDRLNVAKKVLPNTPRFGEIAVNDDQLINEYEIDYKSNSLGVHLLLSLFAQSHLTVTNVRFRLTKVILDLLVEEK